MVKEKLFTFQRGKYIFSETKFPDAFGPEIEIPIIEDMVRCLAYAGTGIAEKARVMRIKSTGGHCWSLGYEYEIINWEDITLEDIDKLV